MYRYLLTIGAALFLSLTPKTGLANGAADYYENMYFGLGGSFLNIDVDGTYYLNGSPNGSGTGSASDVVMAGALLGYQFNPWISAEVRGYFGANDGDFEGIDVEISKYFAIYARPTLPVHEHITLYALLGYGKGTIKALGESDSESDYTYGLGVEVGKGTNLKLQIEYAVLHDRNYTANLSSIESLSYNVKVTGVNANIVWYF